MFVPLSWCLGLLLILHVVLFPVHCVLHIVDMACKKELIFHGNDDQFVTDPKSCRCNNVCNRRTKRGACPCLSRGVFCSSVCQCGTGKSQCQNRAGEPDSQLFADMVFMGETTDDHQIRDVFKDDSADNESVSPIIFFWIILYIAYKV